MAVFYLGNIFPDNLIITKKDYYMGKLLLKTAV
jgi:hypothetical protein